MFDKYQFEWKYIFRYWNHIGWDCELYIASIGLTFVTRFIFVIL